MAHDQNGNDQSKPAQRDGKATGGEEFRGHYGDETGDGSRFLGERGEGAGTPGTPAPGQPADGKPADDEKSR